MFYGPTGIVSAACTTGITIQREVGQSSDRPHFSEPNSQYSTFTCPLLLLLLATAHYSPSSLDTITQLCSASVTEDSNTGKTHHVCFGVIREMMVICLASLMISCAGNVEFANCMHDREKYPEYPGTSRVTLTTDGWTSRDAKGFLTEAVHHVFGFCFGVR